MCQASPCSGNGKDGLRPTATRHQAAMRSMQLVHAHALDRTTCLQLALPRLKSCIGNLCLCLGDPCSEAKPSLL